VLVVGSGAREHALCVALRRDPSVSWLGCAPGNAGTVEVAEPFAVESTDGAQVADLALGVRADLVVIGPEAPLVSGVADAVRAKGVACFGPSEQAAAIEGSKAFAKQVMQSAGVPTARSRACRTTDEVRAALGEFGSPYVVKHDGLAAGKGVVVTTDLERALAHAASHPPVVVEEYLDGPEVSLFAVTDGRTVLPLVPAQDFKRVGDGDTGPNTGGMGAYAPLPWAPADLVDEVIARVIQPTVDELARRGTPFAGLLYAGLALTSRGVQVVEFNARFGDPETQVVLALLETPLAGLLHAAATGTLAEHPPLHWAAGAAVTVVLAAPGYPEAPRAGDRLDGLADAGSVPGVVVLHAGTRAVDHEVRTSGGRVLSVTARGADLDTARAAAYAAISRIKLDGGHYRTDIAALAAQGGVTVPGRE
jgi:phosphoribosylamine--glycine ligase